MRRLVKNSLFKNKRGPRAPVMAAALALCVSIVALAGVAAEEIQAKPGENEPKRIRIKAEKLVADLNEYKAEFSGNVKVTQGDTNLSADTLSIYRHQNVKNQDDTLINTQSIKKIIAQGNVRINFGETAASAERAEYLTETDELLLSGKNATVTRGKHSISGTKLRFYRSEGRIMVDGNAGKQVKAIFSSDQKFFE